MNEKPSLATQDKFMGNPPVRKPKKNDATGPAIQTTSYFLLISVVIQLAKGPDSKAEENVSSATPVNKAPGPARDRAPTFSSLRERFSEGLIRKGRGRRSRSSQGDTAFSYDDFGKASTPECKSDQMNTRLSLCEGGKKTVAYKVRSHCGWSRVT